MLSTISVFKAEDRLSPRYIPKTLPHRDNEINLLLDLFRDTLENISQSHLKTVQIIGGVGTGKTCTDTRFAQILREQAKERGIDLKHVYVNLKLQGKSKVVLYRSILDQGAPEAYSTSLSAEEMLRQLVKYLQDEKRYLLISLDEVDYFLKQADQHLIYDLTRLNEFYPGKPCGVIGLIAIARNTEFHKQLDKAELSTLGINCIEFKPYTAPQIVDILEQRSKEAFKEGAVSAEVIAYIADITASPPVNGDLRYALDLLLYSGHLANNLSEKHVTLEHVRKVHGKVYHPITSEEIQNLPEEEKHVLLGIVRSLKFEGTPYVSLRDIRKAYSVVCEEYNVTKTERLEEAIQDLHDRGIIDVKSLTKIGISGLPAEDLSRFLDNLIERVKGGMSNC